ITAAANRLFVVNDHVDIALLAGADGVHLGPDDITVEGARSVAGDRLLIGASASTPEAARQAIADGADYLGVGPAFETPVKSEKDVIGPEGVLEVAKAAGAGVAVFAIGGIDESEGQQPRRFGRRWGCVIWAMGGGRGHEARGARLGALT